MRTNPNTLLAIFLTTGIVLGLLFLSNHITSSKLNAAENERKSKDVLSLLMDSAGNSNPVINNNLKGKVVVINVWATWCGPCLMEIPELNKLADEFRSDKVAFIAVDGEEAATEGMKMLQYHISFDYQLLFSQQQVINAITSLKLASEENGIPVNLVLGPDGHLKFYYIGNQPDKLKQVHDYLQSVIH